jgi:hypothetical protein
VAILVFCNDVCLLSPNEYEMQILLDICDNYSKNWAIGYNISKCKYMVFGSHKFNNNIFLLDSRPLSFSTNIKYLGIEFNKDLNFSNFFINKFQSISNSYFSLEKENSTDELDVAEFEVVDWFESPPHSRKAAAIKAASPFTEVFLK